MSPLTVALRQAEGVQVRQLVASVARADRGIDATVAGDGTIEVTEAVHDSRAVGVGSLYCCVPGAHHDGHHFAADAVASGAAALLCERPLSLGVPEVRVPSVREAMGPVAAALAGHPSEGMTVIGVTGTNGKTTVTHLLHDIVEAAGRPCGLIGTLSGTRTTPEAPELQHLLSELRQEGTTTVAMEVSSHALDLHRVDGTSFAVGVFTNLSQDHLDHHGDLESYFAAKARLFEVGRCRQAVINADDAHGRRLLKSVAVPAVPYTLDDTEELALDADGSRFTWRGERIHLPVAGRFNVSNALAAATVAALIGIDTPAIAMGLAAARPIAGRFERIDAGQPFLVAVDYAHTPDGLDQLLTAGRELAGAGRVIVVVGAGGDRDASKRPLMGEVVDRLADVVVLTTDNPRREAPEAISDAVQAGMAGRAVLHVEADRAVAIAWALSAADPADVVLVAGKGHEITQVVGDTAHPFDDRVVVLGALAALGHSGRSDAGAVS
ncbi:MAG: UDP-N-acetylmuramoyl-L-alanyl-D-glutamate--2,6-diaminopimelate ligase [Acidimicrobiales bacterium]